MTKLGWFVRYLFISLCIALLAGPAQAKTDGKRLDLYLGEVKVMQVGPIARVAVGNGTVVSTSIHKNGQLIILAEGAGDTILHIWRKDGSEMEYAVSVSEKNAGRAVAEISALIKNIPGLGVRQVGGRAVVEGEVPPDYADIMKVITDAYPTLMNLTRAPKVASDRMIYMNAKITEFTTNDLKNLGVDWQNNINGPAAGFAAEANYGNDLGVLTSAGDPFASLAPGAAQSAFGYFGIASEITSRINLLVQNGSAMILAEPSLSTRSGGEAEFLAGGEIPIPVVTANTTDVEFKEFGISLKIKPVADAQGNILANVRTEVSTVDQSVSVQGVPGFLTRKTTTDVSMRDGQTLVISGLLNQEAGEDIRKFPVLGDVPILGALFKSTNFRNKKTELVIFVTPRILDPESELNRQELARRDRLIRRFEDAVGKKGLID